MTRLFLLLAVGLWIGSWGHINAVEDAILEVPGRIAYIGDDFNVYSLSLHDGGLIQLTDDATQRRRYQWPTWADNNKLAYFCCDPIAAGRPAVQVFVSPDGVEAAELAYEATGEVFTYANWSPRDCNEGPGCRDLAVLLSQSGRGIFEVEIIRISSAGLPRVQLIGESAPFYFSWSPDGRQMLLFRENRRFEIYNVAGDDIQKVQQLPGRFQAPAWSPVDDRLLIGALNADGESTDLVILANGDVQVLQAGLQGLVSFSWSPDGNYAAYRTADGNTVGALSVVDTITGQMVATSDVDNVLAFFWSPDSRKIAFVTLATPRGSFNAARPGPAPIAYAGSPAQPSQQTDGLAWGVLVTASNQTRIYGAFLPTQEMIYMFNFFDQFVQSHQIWSPDSTHIVFSEIKPEGDRTISVLDMTRQNSVPFFIADGVIGIWSYK